MPPLSDTPESAAAAWDWPGPGPVRLVPATVGLINQTWEVLGPSAPAAVLQRLNTRVFSPRVHYDIEAVTRHLVAAGVETPLLLPPRAGGLWHEPAPGAVWRAFSWVGSRTMLRLTHPSQAQQAGHLVGRFHAALHDFSPAFQSVRGPFHDTEGRMAALGTALGIHRDHRLFADVAPVAETLFRAWARLGPPPPLPPRVVHGDLKVSNVRFHGDAAVALVDLDTLAVGTLDAELGDALRSWCNAASEDEAQARLDLDILSAALAGYARGSQAHPPTGAEVASLVHGLARISLELAARFAADALEECYFGWDDRFGTRGDHNLLRARGQLSLALAVEQHRVGAESRAAAALGGPAGRA